MPVHILSVLPVQSTLSFLPSQNQVSLQSLVVPQLTVFADAPLSDMNIVVQPTQSKEISTITTRVEVRPEIFDMGAAIVRYHFDAHLAWQQSESGCGESWWSVLGGGCVLRFVVVGLWEVRVE